MAFNITNAKMLRSSYTLRLSHNIYSQGRSIHVEARNYFSMHGGGTGIVKLPQTMQQAAEGRGRTVNPAAG